MNQRSPAYAEKPHHSEDHHPVRRVILVDENGRTTMRKRWPDRLAGASVDQLKEALAQGPRYKLPPYAKPVQVKPIKALGRQLGYALKRYAEQRIAYSDEQGRQNRRHLPLNSPDQAVFDLWLQNMKFGDRLFLYGCRRPWRRSQR